jgi:hypothetical protein
MTDATGATIARGVTITTGVTIGTIAATDVGPVTGTAAGATDRADNGDSLGR